MISHTYQWLSGIVFWKLTTDIHLAMIRLSVERMHVHCTRTIMYATSTWCCYSQATKRNDSTWVIREEMVVKVYLSLICTSDGWHVISSVFGILAIFSLTEASSSPTLLMAPVSCSGTVLRVNTTEHEQRAEFRVQTGHGETPPMCGARPFGAKRFACCIHAAAVQSQSYTAYRLVQ